MAQDKAKAKKIENREAIEKPAGITKDENADFSKDNLNLIDAETAEKLSTVNTPPIEEMKDLDTALKEAESSTAAVNAKSETQDEVDSDVTDEIDPDKVLADEKEEVLIKTVFKSIGRAFSKLFKKSGSKKKKAFNPLPIDSVERFSPDLTQGLNTEQINTRIGQDLTNYVAQNYSKSYANIIFTNTCTFFNFLCIAVAIAMICFEASITNFAFVIVLIANTLIGIIQEIRAKKSIDKLSLMSSNTAKVIRNGAIIDIPIKEMVLDDLIILQTGNQVSTDSILVEGSAEVNESLLTGESVSIKKEIGSSLFAGSFITSGTCKVRADKIGAENYIEKLSAKAKKYKKPNSELIRSLRLIITIIGIIIIPIAIALFFNNYYNSNGLEGYAAIKNAVLKTATVVVGMIPSGMFLLTSLALAVGVIRLSKNNTLVQDLYSLEMLARVDVLCLDKTGTITDGRMKVNDCIIINSNTPNSIGEAMGSLLNAVNDNNQTSLALYNHFGHNNLLKPSKILPFSSKRKLSGATFVDSGTYIIGAPEFVLKEIPDKVDKLIMQYTSLGMRVLILAYSKSPIVGDEPPASLKPVALITLSDNIREDSVSTIKWFKENDVQVKVISGDNPITVSEIARRVGIDNADKYISLEGLSDREIINIANKYTVFGRVTPEQKAILVKAMKSAGSTVAMTGDGVNDILALKESDCAITVASGSEAARNVANLVLMDSNFSSMPKVVHEGRRVINNIQNSSSLYLMKTIFTTVFALICLAMQIQYPFTPSMMNILEIGVIGLSSLCLSLQANDNRVEGRFIGYVFSRAVPNAFIMLFNVMAVQIFAMIMEATGLYADVITTHDYTTMSIIALTFGGVICLYRQCQPFNVFRGIMFAAVFIIVSFWALYLKQFVIGSMALFPDLTSLLPLKTYWHHILFVFAVVIIDLPLSGLIENIIGKMRGSKKNKNNS